MTDGNDEYEIADISFAPIQMGSIYFYQKDKPKLRYKPSDRKSTRLNSSH